MTGYTLERDGARVHYEVHGRPSSAVPLLLTHGYSASSAMWEPNIDALASDRLVVTWDLRGHGRTRTPDGPGDYSQSVCVEDMAAILDACGIARAHLGGLSLGGYLSLAFHASYPGHVMTLLLFDTGPGFKSTPSRNRWNAFAETTATAFERDGLDALPDSPEVGHGPHDTKGLALAARGILTQHDSSVIDALPNIAVPTLILVGERDAAFLSAAEYMATHIPGAVRYVIGGAGHASNLDQPDAFDTHVREFLDSIDRSPG